MTRSGTSYSGTFGNFATGGTEQYSITATDAAGNQTTSAPGTVVVNPCPQ